MITIDQLLESVDLNFEPRFVTKDKNGMIKMFECKPKKADYYWQDEHPIYGKAFISFIKLSEFDGKDWTECIYEVPRKTNEYEQNLEKTCPADSDLVYRVNLPRKTTGKIEKIKFITSFDILENSTGNQTVSAIGGRELADKINELVVAVNELKAKFTLPVINPDLTAEDLRKMMCDPKYWRDGDSATIQKVQNGFNKLYGDKN